MNYGSVTYLPGVHRWRIVAEPHVKSRLKRVFPRVPQEAADSISLSATPENTRELRWFIQRYPMLVDQPERMADLADQHIRCENRVAALMAGHVPPPDIKLALPARAYQVFAAQLLAVKFGLLLADDVGLGKTVSAIAAMVDPEKLPALVVCPAHLTRQWKAELAEFAPQLRTAILRKGSVYDLAPRRRKKHEGQGELIPPALPDVIITSYHKLRGWAEHLNGQVKFVVFDECQQLRNPGTGIHDACKHVASGATYRLGLSATPIYNLGNEFHHVIDTLLPGALGDYQEFTREHCTSNGGEYRLTDPENFGAYLRREGIMLRRTRKDVGRELPPLTKVIHEIDADQSVLEAMSSDAITLAKVILSSNERHRGEKMQAAAEFDNLMRQATGIAKAPYVAEFVKLLLESGERIVLFGWHRAVYEIWMEALAAYNPVLYTGTESPAQKEESKRRFTEGDSRVMIISLRSGAGLDGLQHHCHIGVFGELDWSPGVHEQCMGRFDRDGQDEPSTAYFLTSTSGSDPVVCEVLGLKRTQIEGVRNPDTALAERVDTGENSIQRLAREFLAKKGIPLAETVTDLPERQAEPA